MRGSDRFFSRSRKKPTEPRIRRRSSIQELIQHTHDSLDVWAVGITIVIGGQYFGWNAGLEAGTVSYGVAILLMGLAYLSLALSMAEMTSMLPFAGGAYGLARCTVGFFVGFLVGICEAMEYIAYVSCAMLQLGRMACAYTPMTQSGLVVLWVAAYVVAATLVTIGGKVFWHWSKCVAVVSIACIVVYCCLSVQFANVPRHAGGDHLVVGGFARFVEAFPLSSWLYAGIESLNMLSNDVVNPKAIIPKGQVTCILTLLATSWAVFLVTVSLPPGMPQVAHELAPLSSGYAMALNMTLATATVISIPATFATIQGLMMAFTNVIAALATSKLLPTMLGSRSKTFNTPTYATLVGSALSLALCIADNFVGGMDAIMFNVSMLFMFAAYTSQCVGYIFLKRRHNALPRSFRSPLGIPGAVFAIYIWVVNIVSIIAFQHDNHITVAIASALVAFWSVYYFAYARRWQTFSNDERSILLFAHVANLENARPKRMTQSVAIAPQSGLQLFRPRKIRSAQKTWNLTSAVSSAHNRVRSSPDSMHVSPGGAPLPPPQNDDLMARLNNPDLFGF